LLSFYEEIQAWQGLLPLIEILFALLSVMRQDYFGKQIFSCIAYPLFML